MIPIKVPPLGESVVEATVSRWTKGPGDAIAAGETVVELETDKVNVEVPALKAGVLSSQARREGDVVKVDDLLGEIDESAVPATAGATAAKPHPAGAAQPGAPPPQPAAPRPAAPRPAAPQSTGPRAAAPSPAPAPAEVRASPAAQRIATEQSVNLAEVRGTGRGGVVSKTDVMEHVKQNAPRGDGGGSSGGNGTPAPPGQPAVAEPTERETRERMSTRRRRIAENLLQSQHQTAHLTTFNEIDMSAVTALRNRVRDRIEKEHGVRLSFMPFFVKAACQALTEFPVVNAQIDGDSIVYRHYVNMGIAVASEQGLVVPVVRDADRKEMLEIARDIGVLATRARDGKLTLDDLTGGTFTITNGGVFGSLLSTPILNYPQSGILGLHKTQDRPVAVNGQVVIRPMMYIALSYDHRLVDGQQAVLFLVRIKELIEDPAAMLVA